jgi:tetratricopeptide (TPR) repeat protein
LKFSICSFLHQILNPPKAREYIERVLKMNPNYREGLTLNGWNDLKAGREALSKKAGKYFEEALKLDGPKAQSFKICEFLD